MTFIEHLQNFPWGDYGLRTLAIALVWIAVWLLTRHLSGVINSLDRRLPGFDIDQREMKAFELKGFSDKVWSWPCSFRRPCIPVRL